MSDSMEIVTRLLLEKFGKEKIEGLLTGDWEVDKAKKKGERPAYIRDMEFACLFCDGEPHNTTVPCKEDYKIGAELLITAISDAREEMSYSNWHADKFDRIVEIIIRYCKEHDVPINFLRERT